MSETSKFDLDKIHLDYENPRLSEFGISKKSKENDILKILWDEMAVNELMYSIVSNGFWDYEPLILLRQDDRYITIEGNRRLAAVKLIHNPEIVNIPKHIKAKITPKLLKDTKKLPGIIVDSRKDSWRYVGFKHVNGPAKWGSFAKAKYISEIHNSYGVSLEDIAYQIGDTNNTAQKLYQALMVLNQAEKENVYNSEDIQANRIYFSHLYTGLQREGIRSFLQIKKTEEESKNPIPQENLPNVGKFLEWLYGSKKDDIQPLIKSQNPDLKQLDEILKSKEATAAINAGENLSYAYELSRASDALFEENLLAVKRNLQKARGYLTTGYKGEEQLLRVSGSIAEIADDLYEEMLKINSETKSRQKKKNRITE